MSSRWYRIAVALALGSLSPAFAPAVESRESAPKLVVHNVQRIYHPSAFSERKDYAKVATVGSRKFFDATPEYKQIAKRKLSPTTAEWMILVKAASDKFKTAVARTASDGGYDLIAETGAVSWDCGDALADATSALLSKLPEETR